MVNRLFSATNLSMVYAVLIRVVLLFYCDALERKGRPSCSPDAFISKTTSMTSEWAQQTFG
jgi:hypothetical protein